jgi:hypothetical protein
MGASVTILTPLLPPHFAGGGTGGRAGGVGGRGGSLLGQHPVPLPSAMPETIPSNSRLQQLLGLYISIKGHMAMLQVIRKVEEQVLEVRRFP